MQYLHEGEGFFRPYHSGPASNYGSPTMTEDGGHAS